MNEALQEARQKREGILYLKKTKDMRAVYHALYLEGFTVRSPGWGPTPIGFAWAIRYSHSNRTPPPPTLAQLYAVEARHRELAWVRKSLEDEMAPPWLIEMVLERW